MKPILIQDLGMIYRTSKSKYKTRYGIFKCPVCEENYETSTSTVNQGKSTRCLKCKHKNTRTHGLRKHPIYPVWQGMKTRCYNKNYNQYKDYGGRGIKICERWLTISNFIDDMYSSYKKGLTIDREDNDGNYEPSNCRWADRQLQNTNTQLLRKDNATGYRGVHKMKGTERYSVSISDRGKRKHIGCYGSAKEGAIAYDNYVTENKLMHPKNLS